MASSPEFPGFVKEIRQDAGKFTIAQATLGGGFESYAGDRHCRDRPSISV
jgi:hypothetical protein